MDVFYDEDQDANNLPLPTGKIKTMTTYKLNKLNSLPKIYIGIKKLKSNLV